jgi:hypothetical protein
MKLFKQLKHLLINLFFFFVVLGLTSGLHAYKIGALLLEPHTFSPFCSTYFGDEV